VIGRIYEDRHSRPALRWFWSITEYVDPAFEITTNNGMPTLEEAKTQFPEAWTKVRGE
jgi:hypothetical protein